MINTGDINIGNKVNIGNRNNINIGSNNHTNNLYKRGDNIKRNAAPAQVKRDFKTARSNRDAKNNLFADQQGNVLKHDGDKWQQRSQNKWQELDSAQQQQIKDRANNIDRQQLKDRASTIDRDKARSALQNNQAQDLARSLSNQRMQQLNNANRARQQGFQRQQQMRQLPRQLPIRGH